MFAQVHTPESLTPHQLDAYLAQGWFRMGQTIFTTNFIRNQQQIHSTIWLRHLLDGYSQDRTGSELFKRNAAFRMGVRLAELTGEKETLYAKYKETVSFPGSESLQQMLFGNALAHSIYSTYEITLHDGDQLIACGFFDLGATGAQGISSFYDPSYKKYSLGKYLIYLKIQYCKELGLQYFYPGYFVPGNSHFDYKLTIGRAALQFFRLSTQSWEPIPMFSAGDIPCEVMRQKLLNVHSILAQANKSSRILKYNFFDRYLIPELRDTGLLDFPLLLYFGLDDDATDPILVFDVRDGHYHLLSCVPAWKPIDANPDTDFYSAYFLMPTAVVHTSDSAEEVAAVILKQINSD